MAPSSPPSLSPLRVEELAQATGVSVDTIRFYQKRRLLPPPAREGRIAWYGHGHAERLRRIQALQQEGFSLDVIRRLLDGDLRSTDAPLAAAVSAAGAEEPGGEELLDVEELAARARVDPALVARLAAEGLLVPLEHDGEPRFTGADVDAVRAGRALVEAGLPAAELIELALSHHRATRGVAEEAVALFDSYVRRPLAGTAMSDEERAEHLVEQFGLMLPAVTDLVAHHFRRVLLRAAEERLRPDPPSDGQEGGR